MSKDFIFFDYPLNDEFSIFRKDIIKYIESEKKSNQYLVRIYMTDNSVKDLHFNDYDNYKKAKKDLKNLFL